MEDEFSTFPVSFKTYPSAASVAFPASASPMNAVDNPSAGRTTPGESKITAAVLPFPMGQNAPSPAVAAAAGPLPHRQQRRQSAPTVKFQATTRTTSERKRGQKLTPAETDAKLGLPTGQVG